MRRREEIALQKQCVSYLNAAVPPPPVGPFWTAINPVPGSSARQGQLAKDMGLIAGVPDFLFFNQDRIYGIELKTSKGRPSKAQEACHESMVLAGAKIHVAKSFDEFVKFVRSI